ncbi:MAG: PAS domain S-box protein [Promethearchaeota archaeon]|nr:MAG: PAS domain S-box protein [Candidatus Lokiarchaeota archaeon]
MSLESRLNFEKVISSISSRFVGKVNLDEAIKSSFEDMGQLSKADRVSLFLFDENSKFFQNTHEWCAEGINPQQTILQKVDIGIISWWIAQVEKISFVNIRDVSTLPNGAQSVEKFMTIQNIQSFLAFPIYIGGSINGFVCFSKIREKVQWKGKDFVILRIFGQTLGDTIERLNAEKALRENQELLRATFEATADGIIAIDNNGVSTHLNERFIYMWRIPEKIVDQKDFNEVLDYMLNQLKNPDVFLLKLTNLEKTSKDAYDMIFFNDGRIFEQYSCPLVQDGEKVGRVWSFKDITEHQHAEQELRLSEKRYREAYERAELFKDIFTHDINNIFHNIRSSAELISLLKSNSDNLDNLEEFFQIIDNQIDRGVKLINNVQKLSKLEESEISLQKVDVYEVLDEAVQFTYKSAQEKELEIKIDKKITTASVKANEFLLDVYENILHNAIKYNQNQPITVQIDICRTSDGKNNYIKMDFKDNGIGILDENKESIFQKGYKKDKRVRGLGIGLSLVKKIIESYNGKIWVENRIDNDYSQGSNFVVEIPEAL